MEGKGIVGHVGRKGLRFALTDQAGDLLAGTMRHYGPEHGSSVCGALCAFQRDVALERLPERLAIAVAGLARGDAISITQTRWFVSRSGLQGMLGQPPLILNDFEAEAWALSSGAQAVDSSGGQAASTMAASTPEIALERPGRYGVLGMTSGLGVSVLERATNGTVQVLATEAGHASFAPCSRAMAELTAAIFPGRFPIVTEHVISANGLLAIYRGLAAAQKLLPRMTTPEEITRLSATDPLARQACEMLCEAFWAYASSLVLIYGTWDGVIVTGRLATSLRQCLTMPRMQKAFMGSGKHARLLASVPRAFAMSEHSELVGAAKALHSRSTYTRDAVERSH